MQSRGCEHTHPGAKEYGLRGLKGRDGEMGHMLSIGRERERILGRTFWPQKEWKRDRLTVIHLCSRIPCALALGQESWNRCANVGPKLLL